MGPFNRILDLNDKNDVEIGAQAICDNALGLINGPTGAVWGRAERGGRDYDFEDVVGKLKGRHGQPIALSIPSDEFVQLIDRSQVHEDLQPLVEDGETLDSYFGALSFVRVLAKKTVLDKAGVPQSARSKEIVTDSGIYNMIQNWTAEGKPNTKRLLACARQLGAHMLAVTSLNRTGQPVVTDIQTALEIFGDELTLMDDPTEQHKLKGSFPIVSLGMNGARLERSDWLSGTTLMRHVMHGLPLDIPEHSDTVNRSLNPEIEAILSREKGHGARLRFIEYLGWTAIGGHST